MLEKRNKLWRSRHQWRLFKIKMHLFAAYHTSIIIDDGLVIENPHWFEFVGQKWCYKYKTMRIPCSCLFCCGEKYNRRAYKKETRRIIKMYLDKL